MTIATEISRSGPYAGAGSVGPFTVSFRFLDQSHLQVVKTSTAGVDSTLTLSTNYTVSGAGNPTGSVTLTSALLTGEKLTIIRKVPFTQEADYLANDTFPAESHETALDKLTQQTQQLAEVQTRTLQFTASNTGSPTLPASGDRANKILSFDASGNPVTLAPSAGSATALILDLASISGTSRIGASQTTPTIVPFLQTVSDIINGQEISLFRFINASNHSGIRAGTNTVDMSFPMADAAANAKAIYMPYGTYNTSGGTYLGTGGAWRGDGRNATIIKPLTSTAVKLIEAGGVGAGIRGVSFVATVAQTSGSFVILSGPETYLDDFYMNGDFNGVLMTGNVARVRHGRFAAGAANSIRIRSEGGDNSQVISDVLMGAQSPPNIAQAGIRVRNSSALMLQNVSVIQQGVGLLIDPTSPAENVFSLYADTCFFDNGTYGMRIIPTGGGGVYRCRFANVWTSSSSFDGVVLSSATANTVVGMHFESIHSVLNVGAGISTGPGCADLSIRGGEICQNAFGIFTNAALVGLKITEATIGAGGGLTGNVSGGIVLNAGVDNFVIANNIMTGNGGTALSDSSGSADRHISNNIGVKTANTGTATVLSGATTVIVNHGLAFAPLVSEITLIRGGGNAGSTDLFVSTITATQFTINTAAAPTVNMPVNWTVRTKGA